MANMVEEGEWSKALKSVKHKTAPGASGIVYLLIRNVEKTTK